MDGYSRTSIFWPVVGSQMALKTKRPCYITVNVSFPFSFFHGWIISHKSVLLFDHGWQLSCSGIFTQNLKMWHLTEGLVCVYFTLEHNSKGEKTENNILDTFSLGALRPRCSLLSVCVCVWRHTQKKNVQLLNWCFFCCVSFCKLSHCGSWDIKYAVDQSRSHEMMTGACNQERTTVTVSKNLCLVPGAWHQRKMANMSMQTIELKGRGKPGW